MVVEAAAGFPASFTFPLFPSKRKEVLGSGYVQRVSVNWTHFLGLYLCVLNEAMWTAIIECIDLGEGEDGFEDDIAELVDYMEELRDGDEAGEKGSQLSTEKYLLSAFEVNTIQTVYQLQFGLAGLILLRDAVGKGYPKYTGPWRKSVEVFLTHTENLLPREEEGVPPLPPLPPPPQGYVRRRRRKEEAV